MPSDTNSDSMPHAVHLVLAFTEGEAPTLVTELALEVMALGTELADTAELGTELVDASELGTELTETASPAMEARIDFCPEQCLL